MGDADLDGGARSWRLIDGLHHRVVVHFGTDLLTPACRGRARCAAAVCAGKDSFRFRAASAAGMRPEFEQPASDKITCACADLDLLSHWIFHRSTRTAMQCGGMCT